MDRRWIAPWARACAALALVAACSTSSSPSGGDASVDDSGDAGTSADVTTGTCPVYPPPVHRPMAITCQSHEGDGGDVDGGPCVGKIVPKDQCLSDQDCGATGFCQCEAPHGSCGSTVIHGNVCTPGNCRTDADCACGFCRGQLDPCTGSLVGFYCVTTHDECFTDKGCAEAGGGVCQYQGGRWACAESPVCPD